MSIEAKSGWFIHAARSPVILSTGLPLHGIILGLIAYLGIQNTILLIFLGLGWPAVAAAFSLTTLLLVLVHRDLKRRHWAQTRVAWRVFAFGTLVSLIIYTLGGEGHYFYANTDWQVRDTILHDLVRYPWPFAYANGMVENALFLRAPLGMYLVPALIAKLGPKDIVDIALLVQNALMLGAVFAAGSVLFNHVKARLVALLIFIGFSGMDCIGALLVGRRPDVHLEHWTNLQYSSHITQAFWVPQHALAAWIGALLYLLWRKGHVPVMAFGVVVPLIALLSPLAIMGLIPFALHAAISTLRQRRLGVTDVALPLLSLGIAFPALLYLTTSTGSVSSHIAAPHWYGYMSSVLLEVGFPLYALFIYRDAHRYGLTTSLIVLGVLLLAPLGHIGEATDFVMRVSIPALAILAVLIAHMFEQPVQTHRHMLALGIAGIAFAIGLATPVTETIRALRFPTSPRPLCNYIGMLPGGYITYTTPVDTLPSMLRPTQPSIAMPAKHTPCWDGLWPAGEVIGLFDPIPQTPARVFDWRNPNANGTH